MGGDIRRDGTLCFSTWLEKTIQMLNTQAVPQVDTDAEKFSWRPGWEQFLLVHNQCFWFQALVQWQAMFGQKGGEPVLWNRSIVASDNCKWIRTVVGTERAEDGGDIWQQMPTPGLSWQYLINTCGTENRDVSAGSAQSSVFKPNPQFHYLSWGLKEKIHEKWLC